ncbi:MAG: hypothetical protein JWN81_374 [Solirubrobacterales bacterium]|nr:hypothetical protein [Solirubrobacterales bacterium]
MRFLGVDAQMDRGRIQALRASPPRLAAAPGARRRVFGAALGQWDALLGASAEVVPAASPILLFYALSQAGRALCAANVPGQPWRASSHGLKIGDPPPAIGETTISPDGGEHGSFAMVCRALATPPLCEPTRLGDLWAANPKLESIEGLGSGHRPAVPLSQISSGEPAVRAVISGDLAANLAEDSQLATSELRTRLNRYPGASDGLFVRARDRLGRDGEPEVEVEWQDDAGEIIEVRRVAPGLAGENSGAWIRPALNDAGDVLPQLSIWWATLLTLSSLARYYPERWGDALDRDRSPTAVPIEEALEVGRELLPWMLVHALTAETH